LTNTGVQQDFHIIGCSCS